MPNRPHPLTDCDEDCRGCLPCYRATGATNCDWNCPHTAETHADDIEELAHGYECSCADCQISRCYENAQEARRD